MDILRSLSRQYEVAEKSYDGPVAGTLNTSSRPQTITEIIDAQIGFHESKIADLKAAKDAISPEVEKALNALAKIS